MNEVTTLIDVIQAGGMMGILVILAVPTLKKKVFGNGNGHSDHKLYEYRLDEYSKNLEKLTETANHNFTSLVDKFGRHEELDREEFSNLNKKVDILIERK